MKNTILLSLLTLVLTNFSFVSDGGYKIGDKVEDFSLKGVDDKMYSMDDFKDANGFIIIFTCNHCPFSVAYEDRIIALQKEYGSKGYPVIAINPNDPVSFPEDNFESMKTRADEKGFNFPYIFDDGQKVYPKFGATKTPHVFLLDKERVVQYIGAIDDSTKEKDVSEKFLANAIDALIKGEMPKPNTTKAIGCSIKVAK